MCATLVASVALSGCGPQGASSFDPALQGTTGYFDRNHVDYIHNGDAYVVGRQKQAERAIATGKPVATPSPGAANLNARIAQIEMSRFDSEHGATPVLFGSDHYRLTVFFTDSAPVVFTGKFDARLHMAAAAGEFKIEGDLRDFRSQGVSPFAAMDRSSGVVALARTDGQARVEISYRALRKKHVVFRDREHPPGPALEARIEQIEKTALWENNWTVVGGKSFYLNDFIVSDPARPAGDLMAFRGESKRTSGADEAFTHPAETLSGALSPKVTLIGNSESSGKRSYRVELSDAGGRDTSEIVVYTEPQNEDPSDAPEDGAVKEARPVVGAPENLSARPAGPLNEPNAPSWTEPSRPSTPRPDAVATGAYLPVHLELKMTALMDTALQRNRDLPGVRESLVAFQAMKGNKPGTERARLQSFFDHANPFRALMSAVAQAFDSNPIAFYLTVDESEYFTGGRYEIQIGDHELAVGPGQIWPDAARESQLSIAAGRDERQYFATSACGVARYLGKITREYLASDMDLTLALMGYNTGAKRARLLARQFGMHWKELDGSRAGMPVEVRRYVNNKLAIYFIANNRAYYTFPNASGHEVDRYPTNGTAFPPFEIHDPQCRAVVSPFMK